MIGVSFWRLLVLGLSLVSSWFIFYPDAAYKPFGLRYWLGILAGVWLGLLALVAAVMWLGSLSLLIYNQFAGGIFWLCFFVFLLALGLGLYFYWALRTLVRRTHYYRSLGGE